MSGESSEKTTVEKLLVGGDPNARSLLNKKLTEQQPASAATAASHVAKATEESDKKNPLHARMR